MRVVGLIVVTALRSCEARCLRWCLRLDDSAANVEGSLLDLVMVASQGTLIGLTLGMSLDTLGIGACICMERMICLLSSVWGMGVLAGVCTLGTIGFCKIVWGIGFFKSVKICLYVSLCCIDGTLLVLCGLRVPAYAHHYLDGFDAFGQCLHHFVSMRDGGIGDAFVLKFDCVG
jgi:hypothetical protein